MVDELFNVVIWYDSGFYDYAARGVSARQAVEHAKALVDLGLPTVDRIMITDSDDYCNFLWERGKGIVFK
jgi:hypothetical protein